MASDDFTDPGDIDLNALLDRYFRPDLSLRGLARAIGVPYSTLQAIRSGTTTNPRQSTVDRIEAGIENLPVRRSVRSRTVADDTEMWTTGKLANLERPSGATAYRLVVRVTGTNGGVASTPWRSLRDSHPSDLLLGGDLHPRAVLRVVWDRR